MSQSREVLEDFARENGLQVLPGVTKKLDFLVVADPYTESSKARQARKYGTSIMSEKVFRELLKTGTN
jgi:DNA polymerase-3 subunit epsilon